MNYFIDTEFLEGPQKTLFGHTKPTIDLISIGIVCEDGREYYSISKDFNLKEAWNRFDIVEHTHTIGFGHNTEIEKERVYWIRDNVLFPIYTDHVHGDMRNHIPFTYKTMKGILKGFGKTNKQIAEEIKEFVFNYKGDFNQIKEDNIQFYGYYSDYDWVAFCWLFGKMIDLPKGFPMFAFDIQQQIEEYKIDKEQLLKEVLQINCHNALQDAIWNKNAYNWIQNKINNGK